MLKNTGLILILLAGTGLGYSKCTELTFREKNLRVFLQLIIFLKGEIRFGNSSLPDACREIARKLPETYRELLNDFSEKLKNSSGCSLGELYSCCVQERIGMLPLSDEEKELIASLGGRLGYLDREMQLRQLALCEDEVIRCLENLRKELPEKKKIYQSLGVLGGILLAVLLW